MVHVQADQARLVALAGTRPRGMTASEDESLESELRTSEKELAEHLMLVDLARNDLGRVCLPGSVTVGPIAQVLRYSNVMHLGTEITGRLKPGHTAVSALKSCFPRGTVAGAPKIRALEVLARLEPEFRGIYSGCVGFIDCRGGMDSAIAIRSALLKDGLVHINAGAGIVYDSEPDKEYAETVNKARAIAEIAMAPANTRK
jgi:anthranilate synthase component 1